MTRVFAVVTLLLMILAVVGWTLYLVASRDAANLRVTVAKYETALAQSRRNVVVLTEAISEQEEALDKLSERAEEMSKHVKHLRDEVAAAEEAHDSEAAIQSDAEALKEAMKAMDELEACRESWHWTQEVDDE